MKKIFVILVIFFTGNKLAYSQSIYSDFTIGVMRVYEKKNERFNRIAKRLVNKYYRADKISYNSDSVICYHIPQMLLRKKPDSLYDPFRSISDSIYSLGPNVFEISDPLENVNFDNFVQYFDPASLTFNEVSLMDQSMNYLNYINTLGKSFIRIIETTQRANYYSHLANFIKLNKPDLIFTVYNLHSLFAVMKNKLYFITDNDQGFVATEICELHNLDKLLKEKLFYLLPWGFQKPIYKVVAG